MSRSAGHVCNPKFDPRIRNIHGVAEISDSNSKSQRSTLFRGYMESVHKVNGAYRRLYFLYNPSGLSWNGNVETDTIGDNTVMDPLDIGGFLMPMSQTVAFSLLFDRTYETWVYDITKEVSYLGVMADIVHLYAMLGIMGNGATASSTPTDTGSGGEVESSTTQEGGADSSAALKAFVDIDSLPDLTPTSFMQYIPMRVIFGSHMSFHGVITSATVQYTHFTQKMVPNRCSVEISIQLFPPEEHSVAHTGTYRPTPFATQSTTPKGRSGR